MSELLVVLMRWPAVGHGKSRLAAALGEDAAHRLHRGFVGDTLGWSASWRRMIAFHPPEARDELARAAPGAALVPQPAGDLGARLAHAFASGFAAGAERVVLVGSDSPTLPRRLVDECLGAADARTLALVPAVDGGFVAMAVARPVAWRLPALLSGIEWSTARTASHVIARAHHADLRVRLAGGWYDVDEPADLVRLVADVERAPERTPRTAAALSGMGLVRAGACRPAS